MSRVSYAMMHPEGAGEMTVGGAQGARRADRHARDAGRHQAGRDPRAGDRRQPDHAPPRCSASTRRRSAARRSRWPPTGRSARRPRELGLRAHPGARVYVLPCIAGHVGADTAGVILAEQPHQAERMTLVVDVGTNAEIVLGDRRPPARRLQPDRPGLRGRPDLRRPARRAGRDRAGPDRPRRRSSRASGSSASTPGPTSRRSRRPSPRPASPASAARASSRSSPSCSSPASSPRTASIDGVAGRALAADRARRPDVRLRPPRGRPAGTGPRIAITQNDVRAIQLAKAALYAGVRLLMDHARDRGGRRDPARRRVRQPDRPAPRDDPRARPRLRPRPRPVGRQRRRDRRAHRAAVAARRGARSRASSGRVEKIETAVEPRFQEHFVEAMAFPHRTAPFPHLAAVVTLPDAPAPSGRGRTRDAPRRADDAGADAVGGRSAEGGRDDRTTRDGAEPAAGPRRQRRPAAAAHAEHVPFLTRDARRRSRSSTRRAWRSSSTTPTRSSRRSASSSAATRTRSGCSATPAPTSRASASGSRAGMCRQIVQATAPRQFTQYARNPERNVEIGEQHTVLAPNYGSPFVRDLDSGRRYGTIEDFRNFVKLTYMTPAPPPLGRDGLRAGRRARSTSATSTWSIRTSATATSRSWARSTRPGARARHRRDGADHVRRRDYLEDHPVDPRA